MDLYVELTWACLKMVYIHVYPLVGMMTMGFGSINMFRPGGWQAHKKDPFSTRDGWICYTVSRVPVSKIDFLDYRFGRPPLSKSSGVLPCASHAGEKSWKAWCWIESSWAGSVVIMELSSSYRRWSSMGPAMPSLLIGGFKDFLQHWICLYIFGMIVPNWLIVSEGLKPPTSLNYGSWSFETCLACFFSHPHLGSMMFPTGR